jgi:anti-anti-sigma factor
VPEERSLSPEAEPLRLSTEHVGPAGVVRLGGELDLDGAPRLVDAIRALAASGGPVVVDLSQVAFSDSTGVRTLLDLSLAGDGPLALLAPSPAVVRVLELTQLRERFIEIGDLEPGTLHRLAHPKV